MRRVRVTKAIAKQGANHCRHAVESKENAHAYWLFVAPVEHADNVHDSWTDTRFEHTQQETQGEHPSVVFGRDVAAEEDGPEEDHGAGVFRNGESLDEVVCWERPEEVAEVEDGGDPTVAVAFKAEVRGQSVGICVV